jgi:hypothetical protein
MEQVVAFGMIRITQRFIGPDLLVISINSIRFVFVGTREFLAIMVRVLFSWGWPTINYFAQKPPQGQKGNKFSSVGATNVPSPSSFSHVPIVPTAGLTILQASFGRSRIFGRSD